MHLTAVVSDKKVQNRPTLEYTYLQSAIKSLFTKIDDMKDVKNMFKLSLFSREFVHLYPESVKDKVLEKINVRCDVENMNNLMKDIDFLKWQITASSSSSNASSSSNNDKKKGHGFQPKNTKKTFHAIDKTNFPPCKVNGY